MINAALDIGNTLVKVGIFNADTLMKKQVFNSLEESIKYLLSEKLDRMVVASVKHDPEELNALLPSKLGALVLKYTTPVPFKNKYRSASLGIDRIALVAGALTLSHNKPAMVIDAGTCITYDYVNQEGEYLGGAISPGLDMRFKSLHTFTAKLPLVEAVNSANWIGNDTPSCMQSGVLNGIIGEINGFIEVYQEHHPDLQVFITGGSANYFESKIKETIFAVPELLLVGLNAILKHNASN